MLSSDVSSKVTGTALTFGQFRTRHHLIEHRRIAICKGNVIAVLSKSKRNLQPQPC